MNTLDKLKKFLQNSDPAQKRSAGNIFKFLAILLALTLIARGTSGATMARVELATPIRSEIVDAVTGTASVASTGTLEITAPEGLTITEMLAGIGQQVGIGDPVAIFDMYDLEERLIRETASLDRMNIDLERLGRNEAVDTTPLENAQRTLQRAREDYNTTVRQGEEDIAAASHTLAQLLEEDAAAYDMPAAIRNYQRALENFNATLEQGQQDVATARENAENVDNTALQNAIRNHARALEDYESTVQQGQDDIAAAQETLDELNARRPADIDRSALDNATRNHQRAVDDYNTTVRQGEENIRTAEDEVFRTANELHFAHLAVPPNPAAVQAALAAFERAEAAVETARNTAESQRLTAARRREDTQASLNQAQQTFDNTTAGEIERAETALETAQNLAADRHATAARRVEDTESSLEQAQRNFDSAVENAQNAITTAENLAADRLQNATRSLEDASFNAGTEVERAQTNLDNAISRARDNRQTAARRVQDAEASLANTEQTHQRNVNQTADTTAQNMINISTMQLDIANQQNTVDTLDELIRQDGVMFASYSGVVSMAMPQGNTTTRQPIIALRDSAAGFEATMHIASADAERLAIGSEAEVTTGGGGMFFTATTMATVSAISEPDDNDRVTVTIALPSGTNWSVGQRIDAQVVLQRANFDMSVPVNAVHSDNSGYFIYVMSQRNTVLGLQNVVERVNVTIVASDNDMVAVRGAVSRDSQVIVGSNKAITAGDRVRTE